jgi:serine/threonine protein kinase
MDMWGVGCVFFEIVSLFPLFPGTNELDQIQKIHNVVGTPPAELLAKMKRRSHHMVRPACAAVEVERPFAFKPPTFVLLQPPDSTRNARVFFSRGAPFGTA